MPCNVLRVKRLDCDNFTIEKTNQDQKNGFGQTEESSKMLKQNISAGQIEQEH